MAEETSISGVEKEADARTPTPLLNEDELFLRFTTSWFPADREHCENWHKEAREDFDFAALRQWTPEDEQSLKDQNRLPLTFDRTNVIIDSVTGAEVANRQEVRYIPRSKNDALQNEMMSEGARWFRDQTKADHEESHAFRDTAVTGMGWTETRLEYEDNPDGDPCIERVSPLAMYWDHTARKPNLTDKRRVWRVYRDYPIEEARAKFADVLVGAGDGKMRELDDTDLDAAWARKGTERTDEPYDASRPRYRYPKPMDGDLGSDDGEANVVTLVEVQWIEREKYYRGIVQKPAEPFTDPNTGMPVTDPNTGMPAMMPSQPERVELSEEEHASMEERAPLMGWQYQAVKQIRKVYYRAFVGGRVLEYGKLFAPPEGSTYKTKGKCNHFSYNCITGKLDANKGHFYGLMRVMKDPQRFANKYMSLIHDIIAKTAKGGIMAERTAFEDPVQAEKSWAAHDAITWMKPGAMNPNQPKVAPKMAAGFPPQLLQMVELAFSSVRDSTGVNAEVLGLRSADQAASLEYQRRQAATTIMATLFDSLKLYRQNQGEVLLYLIINYLADGRLIRIVGDADTPQYTPFELPEDAEVYDVIVDDAPNSPNQKEQTWAVLQQLLPMLVKIVPPPALLPFLDCSPLPPSKVAEFKAELAKLQQQAQQNPPPNPEMMKVQAEVQKSQAQLQFQGQSHQQKMQQSSEEHQMKMQQRAQEAEFEFAMEAQKAERESQMEYQRLEREAMRLSAQQDHEMSLGAMKASQESEMMAKKADQESSMMAKRSQHEMSAQKSSIEPLVQAQMQQTEVVAEGMQAMAGGINEMAGSIGQLAQAITQRDALPPPGHEDMLKAITKLGRKPKGARKTSDGAFTLEYDD
jgi:hypothetical protein